MACTSTSVLPTLAVHRTCYAGLANPSPTHMVSLPALTRPLHQRCSFSTFFTYPGGRRGRIIAMATGDTSDPLKPVSDTLKPIQEAWDKTDDKLAIGGLGFAAIVVLWASTGLIGAIDKLPLLPSAFEFIGILFSGWFVYRYLLFQPDREELVKKIKDSVSQITGQ
uniref:Cyanobacterial aminoacyl-tRNA synthetase CAAD domain-containing protein n=1 Tax=Araucaria cunninghamii TaxID=56994 RepID=A0A0D6QX91_ARACU